LAGDQGQQCHRLGLLVVRLQVGDRPKHAQRVVDQSRHQRLGGLWIVPRTLGLARPIIVVGSKLDPARPWHQPADPADRCDQLGDGVLGGDRVGQDGGVQHPPARPASTPVA
jgi:hypothetical protein